MSRYEIEVERCYSDGHSSSLRLSYRRPTLIDRWRTRGSRQHVTHEHKGRIRTTLTRVSLDGPTA